jgi:hypothetical protein
MARGIFFQEKINCFHVKNLFIASKAVTSVSYIHFESAAGEHSGTKNTFPARRSGL